jgi:hypothetical protein
MGREPAAEVARLEPSEQAGGSGGTTGVTMVLHTWTRDLRFHPHVHAIVTAGGVDESGNWRPTRTIFSPSS